MLFDPMLHTLAFVRSKSPLLLSVLLSVTARFFGEHYRDALAEDAERRLSEAMAKGQVSLETLQAFLVQVYWKRPDDTAAWRRMAYAVTLAYEMNLHRTKVRSDPKYGQRGMRVRRVRTGTCGVALVVIAYGHFLDRIESVLGYVRLSFY